MHEIPMWDNMSSGDCLDRGRLANAQKQNGPAQGKHNPGDVVADRYEIVRELARGGMGSVWVATHRKLDTRVALKFMDTELSKDELARGRFEREAKAAAQLRSPHVVQILDYGVDGQTPFIAMELLAGQDLRTRLMMIDRLPLDVAATILSQACKALQLAGDAGIVHRDLKPGNIFLARSGDEETVKVLDFGLAKAPKRATVGEATKSGILLGSPHYMSPEQARGGVELDTRSDLWSMASILWHMIFGRKPFPGEDLGEVILGICSEPLPVPTDFDAALPPALDAFFAKAFSRKRRDRFQSAREMSATFSRIVAEHLERPELNPSLSGVLQAPAAMMLDPITVTPSTSHNGGGVTLTQATRSLDEPRRGASRRNLGLLASASILAGGIMAWAVLGELSSKNTPTSPDRTGAGSTAAALGTTVAGTAAGTATPTTSPADTSKTTATSKAAASTTTTKSLTAAKSTTAAPSAILDQPQPPGSGIAPTTPSYRPPAVTTTKKPDQHPVLGF